MDTPQWGIQNCVQFPLLGPTAPPMHRWGKLGIKFSQDRSPLTKSGLETEWAYSYGINDITDTSSTPWLLHITTITWLSDCPAYRCAIQTHIRSTQQLKAFTMLCVSLAHDAVRSHSIVDDLAISSGLRPDRLRKTFRWCTCPPSAMVRPQLLVCVLFLIQHLHTLTHTHTHTQTHTTHELHSLLPPSPKVVFRWTWVNLTGSLPHLFFRNNWQAYPFLNPTNSVKVLSLPSTM